MNKDTIYRQAAIDALWKALNEYEDKTEKQFQASDELDVADWIVHRIFVQNMSDIDRKAIQELPSAQPDLDEWCTDCSEYDQERHCCPRWNRVIRQTLKDAPPERKKGEWLQETKHYKDDEQEYYYYEEHCSNCGVKRKIGWGDANFCPNCGSYNVGEEHV